MIKRPFLGLTRPKLTTPVPFGQKEDQVRTAPLPGKVTLVLPSPAAGCEALSIKQGDRVKTGQKVLLMEENEAFMVSTVTGTIADISEHTGYLGRLSISVTRDVDEKDDLDGAFKEFDKTNALETARQFLGSLPGAPDFNALFNRESPLETVVITGIDREPLVTTNRLLLNTDFEGLVDGINCLKNMIPADKILLVMPPEIAPAAEKTGVQVHALQPTYPNTLPEMMMKDCLGKIVPAGKGCEDVGVGFVNAEAVIALGKALSKGEIPVDKTLTLITKEGKSLHVKARIGTQIKDILDLAGVEVKHGDQLVLGGPMGGHAVYSEETPILSDTDAIMVRDADQIVLNLDIPCVNCGECVRACPAQIPVNMLIRLLENGLYEDAAEEYDLLSCIECGLCSYVCIARIPIFHYIMLGKSEIARIQAAEESYA